jgi:hypothetical protein
MQAQLGERTTWRVQVLPILQAISRLLLEVDSARSQLGTRIQFPNKRGAAKGNPFSHQKNKRSECEVATNCRTVGQKEEQKTLG